MKQRLAISGNSVKLRLALEDDIEWLYSLRQLANKNKTVHQVHDFKAHERWFARYLEQEDDFFFVVSDRKTEKKYGTIALVGFNPMVSIVEVGRWLMLPGCSFGVSAIMLAYEIAFEQLAVNVVQARAMERNTNVVNFHKFTGLELLKSRHIEMVDGRGELMVDFQLTKQMWPVTKKKLLSIESTMKKL